MTFAQRVLTAIAIRKRSLREYAGFDSSIGRLVFGAAGMALAAAYQLLGSRLKAVEVAAAVHRAAYTSLTDRLSWRLVSRDLQTATISARYIATSGSAPSTQRFIDEPERLLGTRILVLKSPSTNERGIVVLDYSFVFSLFARLFDVEAIAQRYYLVFEPSWSGYCDLDILSYSQFAFPVFVQSVEPRDTEVLGRAGNNFVPVPTAANWWIDHRLIRPIPDTPKNLDIVMIASWAAFKRHHRVFKTLQTLRRRGHVLTMAVAGYPSGLSKDDILRQADYFGIADQIEVHEWLSPSDVNVLYNRAKVNLLWSRREGFNRGVIEGMLANVPCIMRTGFNYGFCLPYLNALTGRFCAEQDLPATLLEFRDSHHRYHPRDWVLSHMSCQSATEALTTAIRPVALGLGETWSRDPVVKVGALNRMAYWDEQDGKRFAADYEFLKSARRPGADRPIPQAPLPQRVVQPGASGRRPDTVPSTHS
ncbi:MAG: glycosyltransferase [Luteitalea sp.]|nr:glycosyltransferase [Luteitalea sp.]